MDFLNVELSLVFLQSPKTCENCKIGNVELVYEYGKQIFIEPYVPLKLEKKNQLELGYSIILHYIPMIIIVQQYNFEE